MDPFLVISFSETLRQLSLAGRTCWKIGRAPDNDIVVDSQWISRHHGMFQLLDAAGVYFVDLGSHNGSLVNGHRVVAPVKLADGDRLMLGQVKVEFRAPAYPALSAANSPATARSVTVPFRERLMVSVLVVDIRDSTGLARAVGEEVFSKVVAAFHTRAGLALRSERSWGAKSTGDGQMAVWTHDAQAASGLATLPEPRDKGGENPRLGGLDGQVVRLLRAALAIAEIVAAIEGEFALPVTLRIGAGANTGYAMVGYTGEGDRPEYAAVGETVNAAFRLETATKQTGADVMIGEQTYERLFRARYGVEAGNEAQPQAHDAAVAARPPFTRHAVQARGYDAGLNAYGCKFAELRAFLDSSQ